MHTVATIEGQHCTLQWQTDELTVHTDSHAQLTGQMLNENSTMKVLLPIKGRTKKYILNKYSVTTLCVTIYNA